MYCYTVESSALGTADRPMDTEAMLRSLGVSGSELGLEISCIEMSNRGSTALSSEEVLPSFLRRITNWSHSTKTCYYNSL